MKKNNPDADAIFNKLAALFPMELAKKMYIESNGGRKTRRRSTGKKMIIKTNPEATIQLSEKTFSELYQKLDGVEKEIACAIAHDLCLMAISHWRNILHIVNSAINGAVVLNNMLVPVEEKISVFHKEMAKVFANWNEALDQPYRHHFRKNSKQSKQLAQAFAANLRAEIDKTGKLRVTENLVITKCGSRYILEKECKTD